MFTGFGASALEKMIRLTPEATEKMSCLRKTSARQNGGLLPTLSALLT